MTSSIPANLNGIPIPHESSTEDLIQQAAQPAPDCAPAFIALGCRADTKAFYTLLDATKHEDWHKRQLAATALRFHPMGKRSLPAIEPLLADDDHRVIIATAETMAKLGIMSERLIYLLQLDNPKIRAAALKALMTLKQKQIFNYVLTVFQRETFPEPREAAAKFLEHYADESNWRDLVALWIKDVQPEVRVKAVTLASKFGHANDIDFVNDLLEDKDMNVRRAAYQALVKMGG